MRKVRILRTKHERQIRPGEQNRVHALALDQRVRQPSQRLPLFVRRSLVLDDFSVNRAYLVDLPRAQRRHFRHVL
jgi:hypothetical protein